MSYTIDENGFIKLAAMAPQQELSRQLLVASRHPKATAADRAHLEQRSNRLGLGQPLPPESLKAMEGRIHGVSGQGLTELGRLSLPKTAGYPLDENGFIKLAVSRQQAMALQSIPVAQRRARGRPTGGVKNIPSLYEHKQRVSQMTPADKSRFRESMLKGMGIELTSSGGLSHLLPDAPAAAAPIEIMGMTDYGDTSGGTRAKTPAPAPPARARAKAQEVASARTETAAPPRTRGISKGLTTFFEGPGMAKASSFRLPLQQEKGAVAGLPIDASATTAHRGVGKAVGGAGKAVGKGMKKGLVWLDQHGPGESITLANERNARRAQMFGRR